MKASTRRSVIQRLVGSSAIATAGLALVVALLVTDVSAQSLPVPSPGASGRTEILTYDNWTVTCHEGKDAKEKRVCTGQLDVVQEANGARRTVFTWLIGLNKSGAPATALRFPPGVAITPGVALKFADRPIRRVPITTCEPAYCEASTTMDDAFMRDAQAMQQTEALVTASDGRQVTFTINMKGFAQALAAATRK